MSDYAVEVGINSIVVEVSRPDIVIEVSPVGTTGPRGPSGEFSSAYQGTWNPSSAYNYGQLVTYNGAIYMALLDGIVSSPSNNGTTWEIVLPAGQGAQGIPGQPGPQGVPGPQGAPGPNGGAYTHDQQMPSTVWTIQHNLGFVPSVLVADSQDNVVTGDVSIIDINSLILTFQFSFAGHAYLS